MAVPDKEPSPETAAAPESFLSGRELAFIQTKTAVAVKLESLLTGPSLVRDSWTTNAQRALLRAWRAPDTDRTYPITRVLGFLLGVVATPVWVLDMSGLREYAERVVRWLVDAVLQYLLIDRLLEVVPPGLL